MKSTAGILNASALIEAARQATGLTDFGGPALSPALDNLVDAINREARLSSIGVTARANHIVHLLSNRLRLIDLLARRRDIASDTLGRPLVIVGLPRSGTTKLHRMLARDTRFNTIKTWECLSPVPLSDDPDERQVRMGIGEQFSQAAKAHSPEFYAAHPIEAHEPEEDMVLMQHSFLTESMDAEMHVPSYIEWLKSADHLPMYQQFASFLRVLAAEHGQRGQPWLLKGTYHGIYLQALLEVFPDARLVYCHRDPVETIASYASLVSKMRGLLSDAVDTREVGRELLKYWSWHQRTMLEVRKKLPAGCILDVHYRDIVSSMPMLIKSIYEFSEFELSDDLVASMAQWERQNGQHSHGKHSYEASQYGISPAEIADACSEYRQLFIEPERTRRSA